MRFFALFLLLAYPAYAANVFIRDGGSGSGTSWSDALDDLPATLTRGNTYYVADGTYGSYTFNDAVSGATVITVKKATASDHGTETGWVSTYGDGQATFGTLTFHTDYFTIDGATRDEDAWGRSTTAYGFKVYQVYAKNDNPETGGDHITIQYCDIGATYAESPSAGTISGYTNPVYLAGFTSAVTNWTISRCFIHNGKGTLFQFAGVNNVTVEYCWIGPGWGKEAIRGQNTASTVIIRHNDFWESSQTDPNDGSSGITAEIGMWDYWSAQSGVEIYGNTFTNSKEGGRNSVIVVGGDGSGWVGPASNGTLVYNNTFAGIADDPVYPIIDLNGTSTEAKNNLFYLSSGSNTVSASSTATNVTASTDPFVNYSGLDFNITTGSQAEDVGTALAAGYNTDRNGTTRGADGTWDVGAYEYDSGAPDATPPTVSSASIATNGTSITVNFNENVTTGAGGNGGWSATGTTRGAQTMTYSSGTGTAALVFTVPLAFYTIETVTLGYTQPTNGWEDTSGNDLATIVTQATTNNSTQIVPAVPRSVSRAARTGALPFLP